MGEREPSIRPMTPTTSVVVVSYRTPDLTERAVRSALAEPTVGEVVVVDNASGDDTVVRLTAIGDARLHVIASDRNPGFGTAANAAARHATRPVLLFLNSDARLRDGDVARIATEVIRYNGRIIVGPRLVGDDGVVQRSAGLVPRPADLLVRGLGLHRVGAAVRRLPLLGGIVGRSAMATEYDLAISANDATAVSMVSGACFAIGAAAFEEIGGFDERYFMYFEDADLCRRATAAGWPIRYLPDVVVDHVGGASSAVDYHFGPRHAASMIRYLRTWHGIGGIVTGVAVLWLRLVGRAITLRPSTGRAWSSFRAGLGAVLGR